MRKAGRPERIDLRSDAERGIDELPTVHIGVAACQMEKKAYNFCYRSEGERLFVFEEPIDLLSFRYFDSDTAGNDACSSLVKLIPEDLTVHL